MKYEQGWWWPTHEAHMLAWLKSPKNRYVLNGRAAYQGKKQKAFLDLCKDRRVVIDCGAHIGLWAHNFAHEFEQVHCFEPVADHRECFAKNVTADNITMHPIALGAAPGMVSMWTEDGSSGNTQISGAGDIEMRTLDSFAFPVVSALKIDCEGFELNILRGAEELLARHKPVVIVEQKTDMASRFGLPLLGAVRYLESLGYKVVQEISGDFILTPT